MGWQRPRGLMREPAAVHMLGLRVRNPPAAWKSLSCEFCVLSGKSFLRWADHSSRGILPSVVCLECDREALTVRQPWPTTGCCAIWKTITGWLIRDSIPGRPTLVPIQRPIQWEPRSLPPGVKWRGHKARDAPQSTTEVKNEWNYTPTAPTYLHGAYRDNCTFTFSSFR
jgi:hypothetical protein